MFDKSIENEIQSGFFFSTNLRIVRTFSRFVQMIFHGMVLLRTFHVVRTFIVHFVITIVGVKMFRFFFTQNLKAEKQRSKLFEFSSGEKNGIFSLGEFHYWFDSRVVRCIQCI